MPFGPSPPSCRSFEVATTREGSDVVLVTEKDLPPADEGSEATSPCLWWRRGRVELGLKHGAGGIDIYQVLFCPFLSPKGRGTFTGYLNMDKQSSHGEVKRN